MAGIVALVLLAGANACDPPSILDPFVPAGVEYQPPPEYMAWWDEVQECVGVTAPYARLSFYRVAGAAFQTPDFGLASGRWVPPHDLYIAEVHMGNEEIVKHEMVHDLLQGGANDDPRFRECSGLAHP